MAVVELKTKDGRDYRTSDRNEANHLIRTRGYVEQKTKKQTPTKTDDK